MIISGANNLYNNRKTVDELNVFPVPDGDTGTNMSLTATAMATELLKKGDTTLTKAADTMSFATLEVQEVTPVLSCHSFSEVYQRALKAKQNVMRKNLQLL